MRALHNLKYKFKPNLPDDIKRQVADIKQIGLDDVELRVILTPFPHLQVRWFEHYDENDNLLENPYWLPWSDLGVWTSTGPVENFNWNMVTEIVFQ